MFEKILIGSLVAMLLLGAFGIAQAISTPGTIAHHSVFGK